MDACPNLTSEEVGEVLLTASQLARRLSVSRNWVYQAVEDGRLPYRRLGPGGPIRFVSSRGGMEITLFAGRRRGDEPAPA